MQLAALCEQYGPGLLGQPANAVSSTAFVVAAAGILISRRRSRTNRDAPAADRQAGAFAALVAAIGAGSFIQHGPHPDWQAFAHDLPLAATLMFVSVDAVRDLIGRELSPWWWLMPTAAMVPVVAVGPAASTMAQAAMGVTAVGLNLVRALRRPRLRKTVLLALATLAAGSMIGSVSDRTSLCQADSLLQGHAAWHVLAAVALWQVATVIGARGTLATPVRVGGPSADRPADEVVGMAANNAHHGL